MIGRILLGVLLVLAAVAWFANVNPLRVQAGSVSPVSIGLNQFTAGALAAKAVQLPVFDEVGVISIDAVTNPGTTYIAYENATGQLFTKELIFDGGRGCDVSAGELPCARTIDGQDNSQTDISPIPSGTLVHITGGVSNQAVIVSSYEAVSRLPENMTRFTAAVGSSVTLSNGLILTPISVQDDARCIFGVGCFGNGTDRLETMIGIGTATTTTDLIPGTVFLYGKSAILVLSITGAAGHEIATFLVSAAQ